MENTTQTGQNSKQHDAYKRRVCFYAHILSMLSMQLAVLPNLKKTFENRTSYFSLTNKQIIYNSIHSFSCL